MSCSACARGKAEVLAEHVHHVAHEVDGIVPDDGLPESRLGDRLASSSTSLIDVRASLRRPSCPPQLVQAFVVDAVEVRDLWTRVVCTSSRSSSSVVAGGQVRFAIDDDPIRKLARRRIGRARSAPSRRTGRAGRGCRPRGGPRRRTRRCRALRPCRRGIDRAHRSTSASKASASISIMLATAHDRALGVSNGT